MAVTKKYPLVLETSHQTMIKTLLSTGVRLQRFEDGMRVEKNRDFKTNVKENEKKRNHELEDSYFVIKKDT